MPLIIDKGDLFDPAHNFDALAQGVNAQGIMGSGIALVFRDRWPEMYLDYQALCATHKDILPGLIHIWEGEDMTVYNLFTQVMPGPNASYQYLKSSALLMRLHAERAGYTSVGLPWIGCGVGDLVRHNVAHILSQVLELSTVEFKILEG